MATHNDEGEKKMLQGKKALQTGFFKWADPLQAAHFFDQAAKAFKLAQNYARETDALIAAAEAHYKNDAIFASAMALENAARNVTRTISEQDSSQLDQVRNLLSNATYRYREAGEITKAAGCLSQSAKAIGQIGSKYHDEAMKLYIESCSLLQGCGKEALYVDTFREAAGFAVQIQNTKEAIKLTKDMITMLKTINQTNSVHKCYLSLVILLLSTNDRVAARQEYESHFDDIAFLKSDEADASEKLIRAFEANDPDELAEVVKTCRTLHYLDRNIGMLARKLDPFANSRSLASETTKAPVEQNVSKSPPASSFAVPQSTTSSLPRTEEESLVGENSAIEGNEKVLEANQQQVEKPASTPEECSVAFVEGITKELNQVTITNTTTTQNQGIVDDAETIQSQACDMGGTNSSEELGVEAVRIAALERAKAAEAEAAVNNGDDELAFLM